MEIVVQYSCFQDEHLIAANLEHLYGFADRIVIAYGAFQGIKKIRVLWGLPENDSTLDIIKAFPDPERKITLIEAPGGEWEDFTESRKAVLASCGTSGFLMTQDTDEFWAWGALERIREVVSSRVGEDVVAIDCPRIWLVRGVEWCLWPEVGLPYIVPYEELAKSEFVKRRVLVPTLRQGKKILRTIFRKPRWSRSKELIKRMGPKSVWTTFNYANGVAYLPSPPRHIYKVAGFFLKPGLFWTRNQIDSKLIESESGEPWHRHSRATFEPSIFCFHVSYSDPLISRVKATYYKTVFEGISIEEAHVEVLNDHEAAVREYEIADFEGYQVERLPNRLEKILPQQLVKMARAENEGRC